MSWLLRAAKGVWISRQYRYSWVILSLYGR